MAFDAESVGCLGSKGESVKYGGGTTMSSMPIVGLWCDPTYNCTHHAMCIDSLQHILY